MASRYRYPAAVADVPQAITVEEFDAWLAAADPGDRKAYAWAASPPRLAPVWAHARAAVDDHLVTLTQRRMPDGRWEYLADRSREIPAEIVARAAPMPVDEDNPTDLILREIRRAVTLGHVCPSNGTLAQRCGLKDAAAASYRIRQLIALKRITVEDQGAGHPRVATIVGTGKSTLRVTERRS